MNMAKGSIRTLRLLKSALKDKTLRICLANTVGLFVAILTQMLTNAKIKGLSFFKSIKIFNVTIFNFNIIKLIKKFGVLYLYCNAE